MRREVKLSYGSNCQMLRLVLLRCCKVLQPVVYIAKKDVIWKRDVRSDPQRETVKKEEKKPLKKSSFTSRASGWVFPESCVRESVTACWEPLLSLGKIVSFWSVLDRGPEAIRTNVASETWIFSKKRRVHTDLEVSVLWTDQFGVPPPRSV